MKYLVLSIVIFFSPFQAYENPNSKIKSFENKSSIGINTSTPLVYFTFFENMSILLPQDIIRQGDISIENDFGHASLVSENKLVSITVRKKAAADLNMVKRIHESMAVSTYNGVIVTSEFKTVENQSIYIFEQTGFWNDSETEEFWVKFYTNYQGNLYQCLIRYPKGEMDSTKEIREQIINSLTFKPIEK